jgi:hypothetical protein
MRHEEPVDVIPESVAIRRGMQYQVRIDKIDGKDTRVVTHAQQLHPFLIDVLLDRRIITHDHHFYGVQMITMRKVFNNPVGFKFGMLMVRHDDEASSVPALPIHDNDYLKVLREMRNGYFKEIVMQICEEHADPLLASRLGKISASVKFAFDSLSDAVMKVWELKKAERENEERIKNQ